MPLLRPICSDVRPAENCGSGNFGTPCERMHAENLSAAACAAACCAALGGRPPFGEYFLHAFCARVNDGDCGLTPFNVTLPFAFGSGKLGTPCERMHDANFRIVAALPPAIVKLLPEPLLPLPLEVLPPDGGESEDDELVVVEPAPATEGEPGLPPQAAPVRPRQSAAALILSAVIRVMPPGIARAA
jgi:hypothetical protein